MSKAETYHVLRKLAASSDARFIEAVPVVLANCAHRGLELDLDDLVSEYGERSAKRKRLERLLLASADLLAQQGLEVPKGLGRIADTLRAKYGDLMAGEELGLGKNLSISLERLRNTLMRYAVDLERAESAREKERERQFRSFQLNLHLSTLFPPKQKELIMKKLNGDPLSKTEQEYYSRVVKKKLEALANIEIRKIALALTKK